MSKFKYVCDNFCIEELVSPQVYKDRAHRQDWWRFFDPIALEGLDKLRERFGPMTINNYKWGGDRKFSGYHAKGEYKRSEYSGHRAWGSFDILFNNHTAEEVRIMLLGDEPKVAGYRPSIKGFEEITELEVGISWFHVRFNSNIEGVLVYPIS